MDGGAGRTTRCTQAEPDPIVSDFTVPNRTVPLAVTPQTDVLKVEVSEQEDEIKDRPVLKRTEPD